MFWFALASLSPIPVLAAACLWGGGWTLLALLQVTVLVRALDRIGGIALPVRDDPAARRFAQGLNVTLGILHFPLLALGVWSFAGAADHAFWQTGATVLALGLFLGQVSNSNAHELIHAPGRWTRRLGAAVFTSLLFGHHASAHLRVHHVHVASDADPNSARAGEGFYRFLPRAWIGSFAAGWRAETVARARRVPPPSVPSHPYVAYCGGAALTVSAAFVLAGWAGVLSLMGLACLAQVQLLLADYIQHYGLRRHRRADGSLEPAGPEHAWNAPHWYSAAMMLNAPRHSDHHLHPGRRFPALDLDRQSMPVWPWSMPAMARLALVPVLWRKVMNPRVAHWNARQGVGPDPME
ncbi:alkane 1-monooxygenase [Sedimentitalea sp. JM2-8]|uniref:Alkane 1-monooxygenase n=2 Tax=Sedimentitalea xiamensis TaxID=3050037 RepID=A0ABT7F9S5_9RHOB|nr:alkane 1-monooxygenase [Sedimentitalea xiamensis]